MSSIEIAPEPAVIRHRHVTGGCVISISGVIDERFEKERLAENVHGTVILDLSGVRRITSYGVREWTQALKLLKADYIGFIQCRPAFVSQFNMIANFAGGGQLISLYAPYVCDSCGKELESLIDLRRQHSELTSFDLPIVMCEDCKLPAEFDDIPQAYFAYATSGPAPTPPPLAERLIDGRGGDDNDPAARPFRVQKEVEDTVTSLWISGSLDKDARLRRLADGLEGDVVLILSGITHHTEPGVLRLRKLLEEIEELSVPVMLARVPLPLAVALHASPMRSQRARLASLLVPRECVQCRHPQPVEWTHSDLALDATQSVGCDRCGAMVVASAPSEINESLRGQLGLISPMVKRYLARRREPVPVELTPQSVRTQNLLAAEPSGASAESRYTTLRRIGHGGMAEVFLARMSGMGGFEKQVVLKRILPHLAENEAFIEMFLTEARLAANVSHQNVVQIFDVGRDDGQYFIAMEYVRGWDLSSLLRFAQLSSVQFPIRVATKIVADVCAGLHAAHSCEDGQGRPLGIVHRDVSPHNVLMSVDGAVKLTDFGVAKARRDSGEHTPPSSVKGKLAYLAPEQIRSDGRDLDARVDVFAAGILLFQLLTGEQPFRRPTELETLKAIVEEPLPTLQSRRPEIPPALEAIFRRALERDRDDRYGTARALQQDLEQWLAQSGAATSSSDVASFLEQLMTTAERNELISAKQNLLRKTETNSALWSLASSLVPPGDGLPEVEDKDQTPTVTRGVESA